MDARNVTVIIKYPRKIDQTDLYPKLKTLMPNQSKPAYPIVDDVAQNEGPPRARATPSPLEVMSHGENVDARSQQQNQDAAQVVLRRLKEGGALGLKALEQMEAALEATRSVWDAKTKDFKEVPDHRTRLAACELYLAHTVGLPVQRNENLNINASANGPKVERRPATPAMLEALERRLVKMRKELAESPPQRAHI